MVVHAYNFSTPQEAEAGKDSEFRASLYFIGRVSENEKAKEQENKLSYPGIKYECGFSFSFQMAAQQKCYLLNILNFIRSVEMLFVEYSEFYSLA